MTKDQVVLIRDALHAIPNKLGGNSSPVCIICDNLRTFNEQHDFVKWDDDNELIWVTQSPENLDNKNFEQKKKYQTIVTSYEHIQYIFADYTQQAMTNYMKGKLGFTDEQAELARRMYNPTEEEMLKSIRTGEQLEYIEKTTKAFEDKVYSQDNNIKPKL